MKQLIRTNIIIGVLFILAAGASPASAQDGAGSALPAGDTAAAHPSTARSGAQDSPYSLKRGDNEFGFWGGIGFKATRIFGGLREEEARDRRFFIAAFRYGRTLAANRSLALQYTLDVIPVAVATGNIERITTAVTPAGTVTTFERGSAYGAGLTPLGLQLDFANSSRVKPFVHLNGGFLIFNKPVPLPDAGKFAYVGETGAGLRIFTSNEQRRAVSLGAKFYHISNGDRSGSNRGYNQFLFYAGFSIFK
ncbi:MAG TPA: acyloxyacyl hydrolase [Pyrinomonadaceae bacterium]|jgi:hypothetical protein